MMWSGAITATVTPSPPINLCMLMGRQSTLTVGATVYKSMHRVLFEQRLYKAMTMKKLIRTIEKLCTQVIDGRRSLFPMTKRQWETYHAFGAAPPV